MDVLSFKCQILDRLVIKCKIARQSLKFKQNIHNNTFWHLNVHDLYNTKIQICSFNV